MHNASPLFAPDRYSAKRMAKPVHFVCLAPSAREVFLTGDFNGWNPGAHPMKRQPDGAWLVEVPLHHGHHQYIFVVDGRPVLDPKANGIARDRKGERVSLLAVS
ncbi:MAG TPA: isoamylase early set domain-containing protein [Verrucomicrobiae bacterium]|nr:isoamylase early set domain-containing protein [Verrucomicrobiae bacterium]